MHRDPKQNLDWNCRVRKYNSIMVRMLLSSITYFTASVTRYEKLKRYVGGIADKLMMRMGGSSPWESMQAYQEGGMGSG